jgi:hypothetical protein
MAELSIVAEPQTKYRAFVETQKITSRRGPIIGSTDRVFTIGSCFAREVRLALNKLGVAVTPNYGEVRFDPSIARVDNLPAEEHMNYYSAFTICQEIERAAGTWKPAEDDFWTVTSKEWKKSQAFQDPYRRLVFGRTREALADVTKAVDRVIAEAFVSADAFLITYGMTEVFRSKKSGRVVAQRPLYGGGGGVSETEFWQSGFHDNLEATRRTVGLITSQNPNAKIFMTVSPVALERTFSDCDIFVANAESKAILRAVLGQVSREFPSVTYFPAYEAVMSKGSFAFRPDGRHVLPHTVHSIMGAFVEAHVDLGGSGARQDGATGVPESVSEQVHLSAASKKGRSARRADLPRRLGERLRRIARFGR